MGDEGVGNIFIPKECIGREGYLIGYNSLGFEICIIDIFPFHIPISKIHNLLLDTPFVGLKEYLNVDINRINIYIGRSKNIRRFGGVNFSYSQSQ